LLKLAEIMAKAKLTVPMIFCTGEVLYPSQRTKLEKVFGAHVATYYGCNEVGGMAFECEYGNLHVTEEHVILETVDEDGQPVWDQPGRILITDLDNRIMPLLRYELGDVGTLTRQPCQCGRGLLVLKELQGRRQDLLQNARGDILPAIFFAERSRMLRSIRAYQFIQRKINEIVFRYVPNGSTADSEVNDLCAAVKQQLGTDMRVICERCDSISLTPRGKTRLVVGLDSIVADHSGHGDPLFLNS
jgi:phenylacetate-CoA ligase